MYLGDKPSPSEGAGLQQTNIFGPHWSLLLRVWTDATTVVVRRSAADRATRAASLASAPVHTSAVAGCATSPATDLDVIKPVPDGCRAVMRVSASAEKRVRRSVGSATATR